MEISTFLEEAMRCNRCGKKFQAEVWLIVDTVSRADLANHIRNETLHAIICPRCHQLIDKVDFPLLLYRPGKTPTLLFSPAQGTTQQQDMNHVARLIEMLRKRLGKAWQDSWLASTSFLVPREALPIALDAEKIEDSDPEASSRIPPQLREDLQRANLALHYYEMNDDERALDTVLALWRRIIDHPVLSHAPESFQLAVYNDAGNAFLFRYKISHDLDDLDQVIRFWTEAAKHTTSNTTFRPGLFYLLGDAFSSRYQLTMSIQDLERSINYYRDAAAQAPASSSDLLKYLEKLVGVLERHFHRTGSLVSLNQMIEVGQEIIRIIPADSPDMPEYLTSLGNNLMSRFGYREDLVDLGQAIEYYRNVLKLVSSDSPDFPDFLSNLASALATLSKYTGQLYDLEEAIRLFQEVVRRTSPRSPGLSDNLVNLGTARHDRYEQIGQLEDLQKAIQHFREAIELTDSSSPGLLDCFYKLGGSLDDLFVHIGKAEHLAEAIRFLQKAVDGTAPGDDDLPPRLSSLAGSFKNRYMLTGQLADMEAAVTLMRQALELVPSDSRVLHNMISYNLGLILMDRYERTEQEEDMRQAIELFQDAIEHFPKNSVSQADAYISLGNILRKRYHKRGQKEDLANSIVAIRRAAQMLPSDSSVLSRAYNDLGNALRDLYANTKELATLNEMIQVFESALKLAPFESTHRPITLSNLGGALRDRYILLAEQADLQRAKEDYVEACQRGMQLLPILTLETARSWGSWAADREDWTEAAQAYRYAIQAIEYLYRIQLLQTDREVYESSVSGIYDRAAYVMVRAGLPREAVTLLEQGRAKALSATLARDYADLERVKHEDPETYEQYRKAVERSRHFERAERNDRLVPVEGRTQPGMANTSFAEQISKAREEFDTAVARIRCLEGHTKFLAEPTFEDITNAVLPDTPLVYLSTTQRGSIVLLIRTASDNPEIILDDNFNDEDLRGLLVKPGWEKSGFPQGFLPSQVLPASWTGQTFNDALIEVLSSLGKHLMTSIARRLTKLEVSRVILIPTGLLGLFPLHVAPYSEDGKQMALVDAFEVAYVPSARVLTISRQEMRVRRAFPLYLVGVGNPRSSLEHRDSQDTDNPRDLPYASAEVETILNFVPPESGIALYEEQATVEALWRSLPKATIAHLACHGNFEPTEPLDSRLCMANNSYLSLRDLLNAEHRDFARLQMVVLSACETAITDYRRIPDEALGLFSGFLQTGIPSVIGTLWSVGDQSTALLMIRFYELHLHGDKKEGLPPQVPIRALQLAQCWLRDLTKKDLLIYLNDQQLQEPTRFSPMLLTEMLPNVRKEVLQGQGNERPYADPYYWAAFVYYGAWES